MRIGGLCVALSLFAVGCGDDLWPTVAAPTDLTVAVEQGAAADLAAPDMAAPDLARPDLAVADRAVPDLAVPDLAVPDLAVRDLARPDMAQPRDLLPGPCDGGYLNSPAMNACPLGCSPAVTPVTDEGRYHLPFCTPIAYKHDPPASGPHWPWPAPWGWHPEVVPRQWWVHNLEHGGIVLLYNCAWPADGGVPDASAGGGPMADGCDGGAPAVPDDCPTEIAQLVSFYNNHPLDNWFDMLFEVRILITPDPLLPARFAAVSWDWYYPFTTIDPNALQCFIDARYGRGPEVAP
jgi:hypothetical protein